MPVPEYPEVVKVAMEFKSGLRRGQMETTIQMAERWAKISSDFEVIVARITDEILIRQQMGQDIGIEWLRELKYYKDLQRQVEFEYKVYAQYTKGLIDKKAFEAFKNGVYTSEQMLMVSQSQIGNVGFNRLATSEVEALYSLFRKDTPLGELLSPLGADTFSEIQDVFTSSLAMGTPTSMIAQQLVTANLMGLNRAMTIARTEINRAHRTATAEAYRYSNVVKKFKRFANKATACMSCLMKDGEVFESENDLTDHPNGGCTSIPWIVGGKEPVWDYGKDWFLRQDEATQKKMMGSKYFEAWKKEEFELKDIATYRYDKIWGNSPQKTPLWQLRQGNERGTFGAGGRQDELAEKIFNSVAEIEPEVTSALEQVGKNTGGYLEGLEFKQKSIESLGRKIETEAWNLNIPFEKVALNDALRYTMVYDADDLAKGYSDIQNQMRSMGYKELSFRNSFKQGGSYQGLNSNWIDKSGKVFELQVHTPESFYIKDKINHVFYEEWRLLPDSSLRKLELNDIMTANFAPEKYGFRLPKNYETIGRN